MKVTTPGTIIYMPFEMDSGRLNLGGNWVFDTDGDPREKAAAALLFVADQLGIDIGPLREAEESSPVSIDSERITQDVIAIARWRERG